MYKFTLLFIVSLPSLFASAYERPTIVYFHGAYTVFPLKTDKDIRSCIELLQTTPITHITLHFSHQDPTLLANILTHCQEVRSLRLTYSYNEEIFYQILANSPCLLNLRALDVGGARLTYEGLETLANAPHLANLDTLDLTGIILNGTDRFSLTPFISKPNQIKQLVLSETGLDDNNLINITKSPHMHLLQKLVISRNQITSRGIEGIAISAYMRNLTYLNASQNKIEDQEGFWTLSNTLYMENLTYLNLSQNYITNATGVCFASSIHFKNLKQLFMDGPNAIITPDTAIRILNRFTQVFQEIKELTLTLENTAATNTVIESLFQLPTTGALQRLYICEMNNDSLKRASVKNTPWEKIIQQ